MKTIVSSLAMFLISLPGMADVITNTMCSLTLTSTPITESNPTACSITTGPTQGLYSLTASISYTESLPVTGSPSSSVGSSFDANVSSAGSVIPNAADANASGESNVLFYSTGPVRPGYLAFAETTGFSGLVSTLTSNVSVGSLSQSCNESPPGVPTCSGAFAFPLGTGSGVIPFTLGEYFVFSETVSADTIGGGPIPHYGGVSQSFSFTLLDSDGVTPVQLYAAPEPGTSMLLALGFALLTLRCLTRLQWRR